MTGAAGFATGWAGGTIVADAGAPAVAGEVAGAKGAEASSVGLGAACGGAGGATGAGGGIFGFMATGAGVLSPR